MTDPSNIFYATFPTPQAVEATGVPPETLRNWIRRELIVGHRDHEARITGGGKHGNVRRFSFRNVLEIGFAKELLDVGVSDLPGAFAAAIHFAHSGSTIPGPARVPGCPYVRAGRAGETLLCVRGSQSRIVWHEIGKDVLPSLYTRLGAGFAILRVDPVFERIVTALGYDHRAVLNFAYGRAKA